MIDTRVRIGSLDLAAPVMTASGTAGYGTELARYVDLGALGAVVTKSLAPYEWPGNPAPRLHPTAQGMMNAVGLQGPGIDYWLEHVVDDLLATGATVVASIWGRSVDDYARAAELLAGAPAGIVAVEVNLSCPNLEGRGSIFAHDVSLSAEVIAATAACGRPRWAKLSANTDRIVEVADAVVGAGAEAVTCINTLLGLAYDPATLAPTLGAGGGGLSGRAIHPVAVRAVHDVHQALPEVPIVGVGGVASGWDAIELFLAGAVAVQVGTASFADPRASTRIQDEVIAWAVSRGLNSVSEIAALA
ncbi:MAG TPA: dihydroorotate dehydrogenase [Ilumatobacteraceae bacterium]|nr:dihydroorotate dehydrogenase [Ilumatobacteraceae bacterium]